MTKEERLNKLIEQIEEKDKSKGLSDTYLREHGHMTRDEIGIGEYTYGIIMIPIDFVLPFLKELKEIWKNKYMLKEKDAKIEHLEEKRNNQKQELVILNEKQKEMNKLINTVSSYKGMFKKEQKDNKKKDKIIDLMSEQIKIPEPTMKIESFDIKPKTKFGMRYLNKEEVKQYFERKSKE